MHRAESRSRWPGQMNAASGWRITFEKDLIALLHGRVPDLLEKR